MVRVLNVIVAMFAIGLTSAGCRGKPTLSRNAFLGLEAQIVKGDSQVKVVSLCGQPRTKESTSKNGRTVETWTYRYRDGEPLILVVQFEHGLVVSAVAFGSSLE